MKQYFRLIKNIFELLKIKVDKVFAAASSPSAEALKMEYLKCWKLDEKDTPKKIKEYEKCILDQKTMKNDSKVPKNFSKSKPHNLYSQCLGLCGTHCSFKPIVILSLENG